MFFVSWPVWNACSIQAALWGLFRFSDAPNAGTPSGWCDASGFFCIYYGVYLKMIVKPIKE